MKIYRIKDAVGIFETKINEILSSNKNFTSSEIKNKLKYNSVRIDHYNDLLLSNLIFKQLKKVNNLNTSNFMLLLNTFNLSSDWGKAGYLEECNKLNISDEVIKINKATKQIM